MGGQRGRQGLDWVLEVHVGGDRKKDAERNVARYARLGMAEQHRQEEAQRRQEAEQEVARLRAELERLKR